MENSDTPDDPLVRKTVALHQSDWQDIADIKNMLRVVRESEAFRQVVRAGIKVLKGRGRSRE